jgi:hypothetical protein
LVEQHSLQPNEHQQLLSIVQRGLPADASAEEQLRITLALSSLITTLGAGGEVTEAATLA